ncbi:MAG: OmpA family protein [Granulosicoccus sp.]|nr:OmpA family protein [Granulosicoccus sp.]
MKSTLVKLVTVAALSGMMMACSSTPKSQLDVSTEFAPMELTETSRGPMVSLDDVLFDFDQSTLRPEAQPIIQQAAAYLVNNPGRTAVVEGHTDATGDARFNQILSVERARAVKDALMAAGLEANRIKTAGLGETQPVDNNDTRNGRQANRRVEIIFPQSAI